MTLHDLYIKDVEAEEAYKVWRETFHPGETLGEDVECAFLFAFQLGGVQGWRQREKDITEKLKPLIEKMERAKLTTNHSCV